MTPTFTTLLLLAIIVTCRAIWVVGFSQRWKEAAKNSLREQFGKGHRDDDVVEDARRSIANLWLVIAALAWIAVAALYRSGGA